MVGINGALGRYLEVVGPNGAQMRHILVPAHRNSDHVVLRRLTCMWPLIGQGNTKVALATPCTGYTSPRTTKMRGATDQWCCARRGAVQLTHEGRGHERPEDTGVSR